MKIKKDFLLREVPGMNMVMPTGENIRTFNGVLILNNCGVVLYKALKKGADRAALIAALTTQYDVDETIQSFREAGILKD